MSRNSRKNQIKQAIMRKPKYGGPNGGRPTLSSNALGAAAAKKYDRRARVSNGSAVSSGIKYL